MIIITNGKWYIRIRAENDSQLAYLKTLNNPAPIGYMMFSNEFLTKLENQQKIMEGYHGS